MGVQLHRDGDVTTITRRRSTRRARHLVAGNERLRRRCSSLEIAEGAVHVVVATLLWLYAPPVTSAPAVAVVLAVLAGAAGAVRLAFAHAHRSCVACEVGRLVRGGCDQARISDAVEGTDRWRVLDALRAVAAEHGLARPARPASDARHRWLAWALGFAVAMWWAVVLVLVLDVLSAYLYRTATWPDHPGTAYILKQEISGMLPFLTASDLFPVAAFAMRQSADMPRFRLVATVVGVVGLAFVAATWNLGTVYFLPVPLLWLVGAHTRRDLAPVPEPAT